MQDFRGHAGSVGDNLTGLSTFASDIEDMADVMGLTNTVVVGHSMGALVAVSLASGRLKPKGLVLISGSLQPASPELTRITARFAGLSLPLQSGDLDPIFSKDHRDILRQTLRPCAELALQDVGHNPHREAPKEVAKAINVFLGRCLKVS
jgi:pimeloyl-ACP methyl ester carboxylesterase